MQGTYEQLILTGIESRKFDIESLPFIMGTRDGTTLLHAIQDLEHGRLDLPPHQRDECWLDTRKVEYLVTLSRDAFPPGNLEYYQLILPDGTLSGRYINDGSQRLRTAKEILYHPERFGITFEDAEYLMANTSYPVTLKLHRSHQEAMQRFQIVNNNLQLTSYQKAIGDLIYCEGDKQREFWQSFVDDLHKMIYEISLQVVDKPYPSKEALTFWPALHRRKRHDLSLFWRYLSKEKALKDYQVGANIPITSPVKGGAQYFEQLLADRLAHIGQQEATQQLKRFRGIIELETALFADCVDKGNGILYGCYRWLLDVAILRRNYNVPVDPWEQFARKFIHESRGTTNLYYKDIEVPGKQRRMNISLSRMYSLGAVCTIIDSDLMDYMGRKRRPQHKGKRAGWHSSHELPFSKYGEGVTVLEPGMLNMARGAHPISAVAEESLALEDVKK